MKFLPKLEGTLVQQQSEYTWYTAETTVERIFFIFTSLMAGCTVYCFKFSQTNVVDKIKSLLVLMRKGNRLSSSMVIGETSSFNNLHRGLFAQNNVFDSLFVKQMITKMMEDEHLFSVKPHPSDDIEVHPAWMPRFSVEFQEALHNKINVPEIQQAFGFDGNIEKENLKTSFVVRYEGSKNLSTRKNLLKMMFSTHKDTPANNSGGHVMSVIYTFTSDDFLGGTIQFSNRDDGEQQYTTDLFAYNPPHNSIYIFNGSHVSHNGLGVTTGRRWALVMFYETKQTLAEVVQLWSVSKLPVKICEECGKYFTNMETYIRHYSRTKAHVKIVALTC